MGTADFLLNCFLLGDDEKRVFSVKIPRNDNVGILKKLIKEEKAPHLNHIDASDLDLWKVCHPIDDPNSKKPQNEPPLGVNKRLSLLWDGDPSDEDLHILVKAPVNPTPMPTLTLNCLLYDDIQDSLEKGFPIKIDANETVGSLRDAIKEEAMLSLPANSLTLFKASLPVNDTLNTQLLSLDLANCERLKPFSTKLSSFFDYAPEDHLHILIVTEPTSRRSLSTIDKDARLMSQSDAPSPSKRPRIDSEPHTPQKGSVKVVHAQVSPQDMTAKQAKDEMESSFKNFETYILSLASGKLDGFLDSLQPGDKTADLGVHLPHDSILLLHDLGKYPNHERIRELFSGNTVHLFSVSGAGKTRLALDGLCLNWGLYITCRPKLGPGSGSNDFGVATEILQGMSTWNNGESVADIFKNSQAAERTFAMLLCARLFILAHLVIKLPHDTDPMVARRRWVLCQILPPSLKYGGPSLDLFTIILQSLRSASIRILHQLIRHYMLFVTKRFDLFPEGDQTRLFVVIDEAQMAADHLEKYFRSTTGTDMRPILREMYNFFLEYSTVVRGIILSGTGLSMQMVKKAVSSVSAKKVDMVQDQVVTDIGQFDDSSHEVYIRRYLSLSNNISDCRLLERMLYWFPGRHRLTASLIELFISARNVPRHRVLTAFVKRLTGFNLVDATELEDGEPNISDDMFKRIQSYQPITSLEHLFNTPDKEKLIDCLVDVLMRWTLGSQGTDVPIEGYFHEVIALGIGFIAKKTSAQKFNLDKTSVYLSERLVVLSLRTLFEQHPWTTRKSWIHRSIRNAPNNSGLGFTFEEVALLVLMDYFGGKFGSLGDAFHCSALLGLRKVTLVSLRHGSDGLLYSYPVSWDTGISDRFGFKAKSPTDVLKFLDNPDGQTFVFPDTHMGPDLVFFLEDEETGELVLSALQSKVTPNLQTAEWRSAVISVTPQFFYTMMEKGKRTQYASKSYPKLKDDLSKTLELLLGPAVYTPKVANQYCHKLRGYKEEDQKDLPKRQAPRFLSIIATPNDKQDNHLAGERSKDSTEFAVLQWKLVEDYLGSMASVLKRGTGF